MFILPTVFEVCFLSSQNISFGTVLALHRNSQTAPVPWFVCLKTINNNSKCVTRNVPLISTKKVQRFVFRGLWAIVVYVIEIFAMKISQNREEHQDTFDTHHSSSYTTLNVVLVNHPIHIFLQIIVA